MKGKPSKTRYASIQEVAEKQTNNLSGLAKYINHQNNKLSHSD